MVIERMFGTRYWGVYCVTNIRKRRSMIRAGHCLVNRKLLRITVLLRDRLFNIVDLFCGTGALSYGLERADARFEVIGGIDVDEAACETAHLNHPKGVFLCDSIERVSPAMFHRLIGSAAVDVIVGGPPCQGFSSLRPSRGAKIQDPRNRLYKHFLNYVSYLEPTVVLMENVIGLINASNGRLLSDIMGRFSKLGYEADWRVLNAAHYGVPQKRERLILVAVRKNRVKRPTMQFPAPTHAFSGRVIGTRLKHRYLPVPEDAERALGVLDAISDLPAIEAGEFAEHYASRPRNSYQRARRARATAKLLLHCAADHSKKMLKVIRYAGGSKYELPPGLVSSGYSSCYSRMAADEPATTITVKFTSPASSKCIHPEQDRAITPREAARLQSFDDSFKFAGSKSEIASQIGNAVPPLLGKAVAPMLLENLEARNYGA